MVDLLTSNESTKMICCSEKFELYSSDFLFCRE